MAELSDQQQATRARFESLIGAAAPFLDIVLGVGERISRIAEPTDHEYYPIRAGAEQRLPPGPPAPSGDDAAAEDEASEDGTEASEDGTEASSGDGPGAESAQ